MSNYYDYLDKKTATNPDIRRSMPKAAKPPQPPAPRDRSRPEANSIMVEESTATDTMIERVNAYWRK